MKRFVCIAIGIVLLISSCVPATEIPAPHASSTSSLLFTSTPFPSATASPTETPVIPTATITPMAVVPVSASPLILTEFNVGKEMKQLNVIGTGTAHDIEFSPDGKLLAVATGRGVYLYDGATFEQLDFIDVNDSVSAIAFSPDSNVLAIAVDGKASLWNISTGKKIRDLAGELVYIYRLVYGQGGHVAAIGGDCRGCGSPQEAMILWDAKTGRQIFSDHEIWFSTSALAFANDGKQLYYGGGGVIVIDTSNGKQVANYNSGGNIISAAIDVPNDFVFSANGNQLFVTSYEEPTEILNLDTQTQIPIDLCELFITSNGKIGACSKEQKILIFDLKTGQELQSIDIDVDASSLGDMFVISPDSNFLIYYGKAGIYLIDMKTGTKIKTMEMTDFGIAQAGIVELDGVEINAVATLTYSGQAEIYDIRTGNLIRTLKLDCCAISGFNFAPNHKTFATIDTNTLRLWDLQTATVMYEKNLNDKFSGPITFSPDGSSVFLTQAIEGFIVELNLQTGESINHGENSYAYDYADPFAVENYNFNPLGNLVVLGYEDMSGEYHPSFKDLVTGEKIILPYNAYPDPQFLEAFAFNLDGKYLAFGNPTDIYVWNTETLQLQSTLTGHEDRGGDGWIGKIRSLFFNPRSSLLVSVGWDDTIRLWNIRSGREVRRLNVCCSADFTPDGRYLITYGDGVARVWGIPE